MTTIARTRLDRHALLNRYTRIRARTRQLFDLLDPSLYYERPIALRNPVVFYEGHLPAFAVNTLIKRGLGRPGIDPHLEVVFARGIDPESEATAVARGNPAWPSRHAVQEYGDAADRLIREAIARADLERDDQPLLRGAQALWTILEHEEMHQETLAYMWHQIPCDRKRKPSEYVTLPPSHAEASPPTRRIHIPPGRVTLGTNLRDVPFAWDNELDPHVVTVDAFSIDATDVTNADFMEFVEAGGYRDRRWWRDDDWAWLEAEGITHPHFWEPAAAKSTEGNRSERSERSERWYWRGMFERVPLPAAWPVYVTWVEARAYAAWRGLRLPTEAEFQRAAFGAPDGTERRYPWGNELGARPPGNFDFVRWDPEPVDAHPEGASAFGVMDLVGNGWKWTSTVFGPYDGFTPLPSYPEYSADFFDEEHFVMKGASPATARELLRPSFRNWFRARYPYVYATFREAKDA